MFGVVRWVVVTRHPQLGNSDGVAPHKSIACETVFYLVLIERSWSWGDPHSSLPSELR